MPLTIYFFLKLLDSKNKVKDFLILAIIIIITSGSYVTPTVFITTFLALILFLFFKVNLKKTLVYSLIFLVLNAFWLLPFANYTLKKISNYSLSQNFY